MFFYLGTYGELSAQMLLFKGTFEEALKKAQAEKKDLFVDFYADWCGPCKIMADNIFTRQEVGKYFNSNFVCVQVNVEAGENKVLTKKYNVTVLPTMVFISRNGKEMRRIQGAVSPEDLIQNGKIALGEALSFEQLYEKYKKEKNDFTIQQQLLIEAPRFIATQSGYNRQKWGSRIESLFPEYCKNKKLENMINGTDFYILTLYHPQAEKEDPIFDFVTKNYKRFADSVDKPTIFSYLVSLNNGYIIRSCRKGDLSYKERLKRVSGDLKDIYSEFSFGTLSAQEATTLLADATYNLYRHNEDLFFENMNKYYSGKGELVEWGDYAQALEDLAIVFEGKMSKNAYMKCIPWISKALEMNIDAETRTRLLMMLGDCLKNTGNKEKAKQTYNQAFLTCTQIENKIQAKQFQEIIQQTLQEL